MKTIALCIDKENGRSFYGRRTSSDREVRKRLLDMCDTLHVDSYTAAQFTEDYGKGKLRVVDDPAGIGEGTAFIELQDIPEDADRIIIMANGSVQDIDTHEELLGRNEVYQSLVRVQLGGGSDARSDE